MGLLEEASRRVQTAIDRQSDEIVDFLSKYLQHRSVNPILEEGPGEKDCQAWLKRELDSWRSFDSVESWEIAKGRPNVVGVLRGSGGGRDLMFNGHSDVVPVAKEDAPNWTTDPWGGEVKNGRVYGRGATDMKSGITAFLWASRLVADNGIRLKGSVINAATIAEESGEHRLGVDSVMDRGYTADFLVNAEPTNAVICPAGVGLLLFRIKVFGKGGHTSMKWKGLSKRHDDEGDLPGVNAIEKMLKFVSAFKELEARWMNTKKHPLMPRGASNITLSVIKGGEYLGRIPGYCEADFLAWTTPSEPTSRSMEEINRVIARVSRGDPWLRKHPPVVEPAAPELPNGCEPYDLPLEDPAVKTIGEAYKKALKKRKTAWGAFTAVGETIWMKERGIPGLVFGPGELTMGSHGNDEYVPIEQLIDCCRVYAEMILRWCGVAEVSGAGEKNPRLRLGCNS